MEKIHKQEMKVFMNFDRVIQRTAGGQVLEEVVIFVDLTP